MESAGGFFFRMLHLSNFQLEVWRFKGLQVLKISKLKSCIDSKGGHIFVGIGLNTLVKVSE